MLPLDRRVARRLTRFYVLALTVIALLAISGLLYVRQTIRNQYDDGRVLNVAGRQRMLSQRLTKLALLRLEGIPAADTASFGSLLRVWSRTHLQLRDGALEMEKIYSVRKSPELDRMFAAIDPVFRSIYDGLSRINDSRVPTANKRTALAAVLGAEPAYLNQMNDIVFRFDAENVVRVRQLEEVETLLAAATLLTLLLEGLFIFRPTVRYIRGVVWRLTDSERALQEANARLETTNQQLRLTREELVQATEEKFRLQRAEDTIRSAALLEGQEEERRRFARELHDGLGQMLTGLNLHAEKLKNVPLPDEKSQRRFRELSELSQELIQTTRQISHNLMPSVLGDFGLGAALQLLAEQSERSSGLAITVERTGPEARLPAATEIGLYRIAQEALNNALRHAKAQTIRIRLHQEPAQVSLTVEDDGKGFSPKAVEKRPGKLGAGGLENMRTRARLLQGELNLRSARRKGTRIEVNLRITEYT